MFRPSEASHHEGRKGGRARRCRHEWRSEAHVRGRKVREDLYFRLHVFPIHIPPLRERGRDVEHLAAAFIQPLTDDQLKRLRSYDWPGNVCELQNVIERVIILTS